MIGPVSGQCGLLRAGNGWVAEWSKAHAWNACRRGTVSRVRIPPHPPHTLLSVLLGFSGLYTLDVDAKPQPHQTESFDRL